MDAVAASESSDGKRAAKSAAAWRRAFSSGFLFAELLDAEVLCQWKCTWLSHVSSEDKKTDN